MMFGKLVAIFDVTPKFRIRNTNFPDRCVKNNTDANLEGFRERSPTFCCRPSFLDQARPKTPGFGLRKVFQRLHNPIFVGYKNLDCH